MSKSLENEILKVYDNILSGLPHISSLNIDVKNIKKLFEYTDSKRHVVDEDVILAHRRFIGEVVYSIDDADITRVKKYILFPDFKVRSFMINPEYFYGDTYSLEKSVVMGKQQELNFVINDPQYNVLDSVRNILVLNVIRVSYTFDVDYYCLTMKSIPSSLFYDYYARLINSYKRYRQISDDDYIRIKSLAIRECLNILGDVPSDLEGEFTIKRNDYAKLKSYLKKKYNLDFNDEFKSITGQTASVWNNLGVLRYDNRDLVEKDKEEDLVPYPLIYQRNNQLK